MSTNKQSKDSIRIINPFEIKNWNEIISKFQAFSFFHTSEWAAVITASYNYEPAYFCFFDSDNINSIIPAMVVKSKFTGNRLVSLPFSDHCEPLTNSFDEIEQLKEEIFTFCMDGNLKYIEFRSSETKFPFETEFFRTDLRHIIYLEKTDQEIFKNFHDNTKRNIKSAQKEKITIKEENSFEGLKKFYRLHCITRRKHGLPPQPFSFFRNIFKFIISVSKGTILFAYNNNVPVASVILFHFNKKVLYKFGASLTLGLPKGVNQLLMWEAIKKYIQLGYEEFDFGRTEIEHAGLRRYKLGFGADERMIYTTRYNIATNKFIQPSSNSIGLHNRIFNRLPIFVLKIFGNTLYKHLG
ncbi:MAG: GNAT family N-acetyltransferase [Ignavibacterium sp.]|uniref:lipid II:glycine glycyltransferase FemX n=1 Tax=Ignavibacterium album TaxID=591197 RepID=UPI0026EE9F30|nr:GNAT family N-acetyltransferase [Ignavibacterium album]MCA2005411.1 GNAT family N-acetyltransferase [Ignavibacterium sp.]MCX8105874.1 GNAT family N-acetyltransferase [Ignavibacterium album]